MNMIKYAMPFIPLADKTGLNARHSNIPSKYDTQKKFESEYIHPILGKLEANWPAWVMGRDTKIVPTTKVPMREVYDKIIQALGYTHTDITKDPDYINKLNAFRSSPNSQLQPIPELISFACWPEIPGYNLPMYTHLDKTVYSSPTDLDSINRSRALKDTNGLADYFKNYNHYDRNKYNITLNNVVAHEALGHAGNFPKYYLGFYEPIAKREGKSVEEIVPLYRKFYPTYWGPSGGEAEFTLSLHAVKRQGREWGYPVDSDNDEEVTQAFRDTINRLLKMPLDQARKLPLESQRFRSYLNNARLFNSYKEDPESNWFMNDLRKKYNKFKSLHAEDQNNPHLMDQITEDVLYYTTPETLKGLLASNNNNQLNKQAALSPWASNPDNTSSKKNPIHTVSGTTIPELEVSSKQPAKFNLNIKNLAEAADKFPHAAFEGDLQNPLQYSTLSKYITLYPPTPAGVPYRRISTATNHGGAMDIWHTMSRVTGKLNDTNEFPEKLSFLFPGSAISVSDDIAPNTPIYLVDGKDAAKWLWERRGLKFTDELWDRAAKARLEATSQLYNLPQSIYYSWSKDDDTYAYSLGFHGLKSNNLHFNVFNPKSFDLNYFYSPYNGYTTYKMGTPLKPWLQFMDFLDVQDHELSHSFNSIQPHTLDDYDGELIWDGWNSGYKDHMFFRKTNNPELPYYDDATTELRVKDYSDIFANTYLLRPGEYMGAMARAKRYGAELGFDTTSQDPATARAAMAQALHYLATHQKPEELTPELQRLNSWLNTAATNYVHKYNLDYGTRLKALEDYSDYDAITVDEYIERINKKDLLKLEIRNKANELKKDSKSQFYKDVLLFMTDSTIQGLVRNDTQNNLNNTYLA